MPVLSPAYFGNLQHVYVGNNLILLEKFSQTQRNTVSTKPMIQGTLGTRVMDVGEIIWDTTIESSALIFEQGALSFGDIFGLVDLGWANIRSANNLYGAPSMPLMDKATISINKEKVSCNASFISGNDAPFQVVNERDSSLFIARVAKWFDCTLLASSMPLGFSGAFSNNTISVGVESAQIELKAKITPRFFIGSTSQEPYFSIDNYEISGNMTVIASAADMANAYNFIIPQSRGFLSRNGPVSLTLFIGARSLELGLTSLRTEFTRSVTAGDVNRISFKFTSFTT
jgi:hypothetical protein